MRQGRTQAGLAGRSPETDGSSGEERAEIDGS